MLNVNLVQNLISNKKTFLFYFIRIIECLFVLIISVGIVQLFQSLLIKFNLLPNKLNLFASFHIFSISYIQASIFICIFLIFQKIKKPFLFLWGELPTIPVFIKYFFGMLAVNMCSALLMQLLHIDVKQYESFNKILIQQSPLFFLGAVVIIAPIYEEFIFRGFLLRYLYSPLNENLENYKKWVVSVIISSIFFAAIHFDLDAFIPILFLSFYLSFVTVATKSITLSTLLHASQNLLSSLAFLYLDLPKT